MTAAQAIEFKRMNQERSFKAKKQTWFEIQQVQDEQLRSDLTKAFSKPVRNLTNKRQG